MPRQIRIEGCNPCPFAHKYRAEWECRFRIGRVINHRTGWFAEWCPLIEENGILLIADTYKGQKGREDV